MRLKRNDLQIVAISLALLTLIGLNALGRPSPADANPYHERIRKAVQTMPLRIGKWVGLNEPVPGVAVDLLKPNALVHRMYRHVETNLTVTLMLVQCQDARDLAGHYPPICYPAHGWQLQHKTPREWDCRGLLVNGTEYEFSYGTFGGADRMNVANFMLLPGGGTSPDMAAVYHVAADYKRRFYGAAQMQIITDARLPEDQRHHIIQEFLGANLQALNAILSGGTQ